MCMLNLNPLVKFSLRHQLGIKQRIFKFVLLCLNHQPPTIDFSLDFILNPLTLINIHPSRKTHTHIYITYSKTALLLWIFENTFSDFEALTTSSSLLHPRDKRAYNKQFLQELILIPLLASEGENLARTNNNNHTPCNLISEVWRASVYTALNQWKSGINF